MNCTTFLPHNYQMLYSYDAEPVPEERNAGTEKDEGEGLPAIASHFLLTEGMRRQKEPESVPTLSGDLAALLQGSVKCKKGKPPSTKETKREAFDRYMNIIYRLPPSVKIDWEDMFDPDKLSFDPDPSGDKPRKIPAFQEKVRPESDSNIPVSVEKKKEKKGSVTTSKPVKTLMKVKPRPVDIPKKPVIVEKDELPPEAVCPIEQPKPKTPSPPTPPQCPRSPTPPPPQREPTPEAPAFLRPFADASWFKDLYPDKKCITSALSPEDFSLQLLGCFNACSAPSQIKILAALQLLQSQGLLQSTDMLRQGLIDLLHKCVRPNMSPVERTVLVEMLNLLMRLQPADYEFVKKLLALLAFKKLCLQETVFRLLASLGVTEAEQWLTPELDSWDSELQDASNTWESLHDRADRWLELWTAKYKVTETYTGRDGHRHLRSRPTAKWGPPAFSVVDVLNYFCSVQKDEHRRARCVASPGRKNTVLLPLYHCSYKPILRLGETYSMARMFRPPGLLLPPLRDRPFLARFPKFISLPLPRVTLRPFHIYSDEDWVKVSTRRYFSLQQSYVDYYR